MKYKFVPYDTKLVFRARELRKSQTKAEKIFWEQVLRHERLLGFKFTRQKPVGKFIVDFYCAKFKLAIELDGELHDFQVDRDKERDDYLKEKFGLKIIRYRNEEILNDPDKILENLLRVISSFPLTRGIKGVVSKIKTHP